MANHAPQFIEHISHTPAKPMIYWRCKTCGETNANSPGTRLDAEDAAMAHAKKIERVRANLGRGRGSLATEREQAKRKLDDPNTPKHERPMWQMLYDGAVARIGQRGEKPSEDTLW